MFQKFADTEDYSVVPDKEVKELEKEAALRKEANLRRTFKGIIDRPTAKRFKS